MKQKTNKIKNKISIKFLNRLNSFANRQNKMKIKNETERKVREQRREGDFFFASTTAKQTSFLVYKRVVYKEVATLLK